jgi:hypothetical protein
MLPEQPNEREDGTAAELPELVKNLLDVSVWIPDRHYESALDTKPAGCILRSQDGNTVDRTAPESSAVVCECRGFGSELSQVAEDSATQLSCSEEDEGPPGPPAGNVKLALLASSCLFFRLVQNLRQGRIGHDDIL